MRLPVAVIVLTCVAIGAMFIPVCRAEDLAICNTTAEVVFLLDTSSSVGPDNFQHMKTFIQNVTLILKREYKRLNVTVITFSDDAKWNFTQNVTLTLKREYKRLNVTVITFSDDAKVEFALDATADTRDVLAAEANITYSHGGTQTHKALQLVYQSAFHNDVTSPKIAILITDGASWEAELTREAAKAVKDSGIAIFVVGVGDDVNPHEIQAISSEPHEKHLFHLESFSALSSLVNVFHSQDCIPDISTSTQRTSTMELTTESALKPIQTTLLQPGTIPQRIPTSRPELVTGKTPTAQPSLASAQTPTAHVAEVSGKTPIMPETRKTASSLFPTSETPIVKSTTQFKTDDLTTTTTQAPEILTTMTTEAKTTQEPHTTNEPTVQSTQEVVLTSTNEPHVDSTIEITTETGDTSEQTTQPVTTLTSLTATHTASASHTTRHEIPTTVASDVVTTVEETPTSLSEQHTTTTSHTTRQASPTTAIPTIISTEQETISTEDVITTEPVMTSISPSVSIQQETTAATTTSDDTTLHTTTTIEIEEFTTQAHTTNEPGVKTTAGIATTTEEVDLQTTSVHVSVSTKEQTTSVPMSTDEPEVQTTQESTTTELDIQTTAESTIEMSIAVTTTTNIPDGETTATSKTTSTTTTNGPMTIATTPEEIATTQTATDVHVQSTPESTEAMEQLTTETIKRTNKRTITISEEQTTSETTQTIQEPDMRTTVESSTTTTELQDSTTHRLATQVPPHSTEEETSPTPVKEETTTTELQESTTHRLATQGSPHSTEEETSPTPVKEETTTTDLQESTTHRLVTQGSPHSTEEETSPTPVKEETTTTDLQESTTHRLATQGSPHSTEEDTSPNPVKEETSAVIVTWQTNTNTDVTADVGTLSSTVPISAETLPSTPMILAPEPETQQTSQSAETTAQLEDTSTVKDITTSTPKPVEITTTVPTSTTTASCIAKVADVVFVVDSSGSIGLTNFQKVKEFIKDVVRTFDIDSKYTRVGLIEYSTSPRIEFKLHEHDNLTELMEAIDNVTYSGGGTSTSDALELMRIEGFDRERPLAPDIAIVITDGLSKYPSVTRAQANLAKADGITMFSIGIGNETRGTELHAIASDHRFVFEVGDFETLFQAHLDNAIAHRTCGVNLPEEYHTRAPKHSTTTPKGCVDIDARCASYPRDSCSDYAPWARKNCARKCGFCPEFPIVERPCEDREMNCAQYGTSMCSSTLQYEWVDSHCRKFCGFCGNKTEGTSPTSTTVATPVITTEPGCVDISRDCDKFGPDFCANPATSAWARSNCARFCQFCLVYEPVTSVSVNNVMCPAWQLPVECSLDYTSGSCCPLPKCPDDFRLTVQRD